eukprot:159037-Prymnesium_polylepis.1
MAEGLEGLGGVDRCGAAGGGGGGGGGIPRRRMCRSTPAAKPVVFQPAHADSAASCSTNTRPNTSSQRI